MVEGPPPAPQSVASAAAPAGCLTDALARSLLTLRSRDGALTAVIAPSLGGAMVGLQWRGGGEPRELLYRGMNFCPTRDFDGKAPTLWPATGRTYIAVDGAAPRPGWRWNGQDHAMPTHGFARDRPWRVVRASGREITLRLDDDATTRALYPFRFTMTTGYRITGRTLTIRYRVTAGTNATPMPFSIGNHITFALPLGGTGAASDATITTAPGTRVTLDRFGRPDGRVPQAALRDTPLATLGRQTAIALAGYPATATATLTQPGWGSIAIASRASERATGDAVRFTLWGDAAGGYFAAEPWFGLQNALASGEGLIRLAPGRSFEWTVTVRVDA